jgi:hypothetical protein
MPLIQLDLEGQSITVVMDHEDRPLGHVATDGDAVKVVPWIRDCSFRNAKAAVRTAPSIS